MALSVRERIDNLIAETVDCRQDQIPTPLLSNIKKWNWGSYGWVSPASLIFTATWRKAFYPEEDCCKIWAKDEQNKHIPGSYSIRSEDEAISIPLLAKHDLCPGFCSDNSGMQGSRAIEKMRSFRRLNTDFNASQRTVFDLKLFATILNQINELTNEQAFEVLRLLIMIAKSIRAKRITATIALRSDPARNVDVMDFLGRTADPELTKCVTAACLDAIFNPHSCVINGVEGYKTAADARAQKPGDLCLLYDEEPRIGIEVKDKTQTIDWNNIERARKILDANQTLRNFIFVLERRDAAVAPIIAEFVSAAKFRTPPYNKISIIALHDLHLLAASVVDAMILANKISKYIAVAPTVKPETKDAWIQAVKPE